MITLLGYIELTFYVLVEKREIESVFCKTVKVSSVSETSLIKMEGVIALLTAIMVI